MRSIIHSNRGAALSANVMRKHTHTLVLSCLLGLVGAFCGADAFAGELDCNNNGVPDAEELSGNDCNANGVLDVCENDVLSNEVEFSAGYPDGSYRFPEFDLEGELLVIGSPHFRGSDGVLRSVVNIHRHVAGSWVLEQTIEWPDLSAQFGSRVDISGDRIAVTAPNYYNSGVASRGLVIVYHYDVNSQSWAEEARLTDDAYRDHWMGRDLSFEGENLAVASVAGISASPRISHVLCYRRVDGEWKQIQRILTRDVSLRPQFLFFRTEFVRLGPDTMVLSEFVRLPDKLDGVFVASTYEFDGSAWIPTSSAELQAASESTTPYIGIQVSKQRIILPNCSPDEGWHSKIEVFKKEAGAWVEDAQLDYVPMYGDGLQTGWSARDGERMFIGLGTWSLGNAMRRIDEVVFGEGDTHIETRRELESVYIRLRFDVSGNRIANIVYSPPALVQMFDVSGDCNGDGLLDECSIASGSADVDGNLVPDDCAFDCNLDGIPDDTQIADDDCNANGILDECDLDAGDPDGDGYVAADCNGNGLPDECEPDCDGNGIPDECDLDAGDPDGDGQIASDCNGNGIPDSCDILDGVSEIARLTPSDGDAPVNFGKSLAVEGDTVVVGAPGSAPGPETGGKVYVYRFSGNQWNETILRPAADAGNVYFGWRVDIENGRIFVGQMTYESPYDYRAIVFEQVDGAWQQVDSILISSDQFLTGSAFAANADELITYGPDNATVTVYRLVGGDWIIDRQYTELVPSAPPGGYTDRGIAMSDDWVVLSGNVPDVGIGAVIYRSAQPDGAVESIFPVAALTWLVARGAIAIEGDSVFVGFPFVEHPLATNRFAGGVDVVSRHEGTWHRDASLFAQDVSETRVGWSVAASGRQLFVASPNANSSDGLVRLYVSDGPSWSERAVIDSPFVGQALQFGAELAASERLLAVTAGSALYPGNSSDPGPDTVVVYSIDLDVDDDGILDTCETDCDNNHYPDDGERSIDGFVWALLHGGAACVFDMNGDDAVDGLDVPPFVDQLVTGP